jgi:hypothetical protein
MAKKRSLRLATRNRGLVGRGKGEEHAVTFGPDFCTAVREGGAAYEYAMNLQDLLIGLVAEPGQQRRRPLDVGETEGHQPRWQRVHVLTMPF